MWGSLGAARSGYDGGAIPHPGAHACVNAGDCGDAGVFSDGGSLTNDGGYSGGAAHADTGALTNAAVETRTDGKSYARARTDADAHN